jgi:DNA-binding MarR family transcriptional regulator
LPRKPKSADERAMSVLYLNSAFNAIDLAPTPRFVLLALADHADDAGRCYPSIARLAQRTGLSPRSIQTSIKKLQAKGYIDVEVNAGKRGTNVYVLRLTPAGTALPKEIHPARDSPPPRKGCTPSPAGAAPEPSYNRQEPSKENPLTPPLDSERLDQSKLTPEQTTTSAKGNHATKVKEGVADGYVDVEAEFEAVYRHYPRKTANGAARKAWIKARRVAAFIEITEPLFQWILLQRETDTKFIPYFSTWLNEERWKDDQDHASARVATTSDRLNRLGDPTVVNRSTPILGFDLSAIERKT